MELNLDPKRSLYLEIRALLKQREKQHEKPKIKASNSLWNEKTPQFFTLSQNFFKDSKSKFVKFCKKLVWCRLYLNTKTQAWNMKGTPRNLEFFEKTQNFEKTMWSTYSHDAVAEADKLFGQGGRHFENYFPSFGRRRSNKLARSWLKLLDFKTLSIRLGL